MTSSQFRSATGLPGKSEHQCSSRPDIKKELPDRHEPRNSPQAAPATFTGQKPPFDDSKPSLPSPDPQESAQSTPKANIKISANNGPFQGSNPNEPTAPTQRTVVYETDAESDYNDSEDELPKLPSSVKGEDTAERDDVKDDNESNYLDTESQELPPPPVPEQDIDSRPFPSEPNLESDASICYQRLHPDTQYPLEPVPTINTQKMAELFPEESNGLHTITPSPSSSPKTTRPAPTFSMMSQTQDLDDGHAGSQDAGKIASEVVPESSPAARHEASASLNSRGPAARDVVVQVESSQPADRARRQTAAEQNSAPKMLTRSQILTSSVMESIPISGFWPSSQDSLGEPYSLPDTS